MDLSIIIQSCDKYEKFWQGLFYYMNKFWDKEIEVPIYFCNEYKIPQTNFIHLPTGSGSFVQNLTYILNNIKTKHVFYMLEDFWPICTIDKNLFYNLYNFFNNNDLKSLQVSNYNNYYKLEKTNYKIKNQNILKFCSDSSWKFSFQSRFWQKDFLLECLREPKISERVVNSAISVEVECDKNISKEIDIYFYHYLWYPMSGVAYRGEFTNLGKELQNNMLVDLYGINFSNQ